MLKVVFVVLLLVVAPLFAEIHRKSLAGPPSEFAEHLLPNPSALASLHSSSGLIPVHFEATSTSSASWSSQLPIDSTSNFTFTIFSNVEKQLEIFLAPPSNKQRLVPVAAFEQNANNKITKTEGSFGIDGFQLATITYLVESPEEGLWDVQIVATQLAKDQLLALTATDKPIAYFLLDNNSPFKTFSHLTNYDLLVGSEVGVVARLFDAPAFASAKLRSNTHQIPAAVLVENMAVSLDITFPDGQEHIIAMHDDGAHADLLANDGVYGATVKATEAGKYTAQVVMKGLDPNGLPFLRTTQHVVEVIEPQLTMANSPAIASVREDSDDVEIAIPVALLKQTNGETNVEYKAYSEVWGTSAEGKEVAVAWVSGIVVAKQVNGQAYIPLSLNMNWVSMAKAQEPFTLRNFYAQDVTTSIPVAQTAQIDVVVEKAHSLKLAASLMSRPAVIDITEQMRMGPRPLKYAKSNHTSRAEGGKLLLVHGYCSGGSPWSAEDFTDYVVFSDFNQARSNDEFAKLILQVGSSYPSFSIAAHSQGGLAALHLYTFYWSGADNAPAGKRIIQSVGAPYYGNSLAGSLASIGNAVGVGCGSVYDLTVEGAGLWSRTIPKAARQQVGYYTTQYKDWSWCNLAANAVLQWPNDGTAEKEYSDLVNAQNLGHKKGWCHSKDMKYPEQCKDHERNAQINSDAAR